MLKAAEGADRLPTGILALPRSGTETLPAQIIGIVDPLSVPSQVAFPRPDGSTEWCIWAPHHQKVSLVLWEHAEKSTHVMMRDEAGYFRWSGPGGHGQLYAYRIGDAAREYPDPGVALAAEGSASRRPSSIPRASRGRTRAGRRGGRGAVDLRAARRYVHAGRHLRRRGRAIARAARARHYGHRIDADRAIFGTHNWGYDGVHPFAAQNTYGGPKGLQRLVDAAHRVGLGVILDVVYNHLGPEGNYFGTFAPCFTDRYHTPWGAALNYDGPDSDAVRKLVLDNGAMWIRDFHLDGLRLDAVQTIYDAGALHILAELQETVQQVRTRRISRHDRDRRNESERHASGHAAMKGAMVSTVFGRMIFTTASTPLLTGERDGYYHDYGDPAIGQVAAGRVRLRRPVRQLHRRRHGNRVGGAPARSSSSACRIMTRSATGLWGPAGQYIVARAVAAGRDASALVSGNTDVVHGRRVWRDAPFPFFCSFSDPGLVEGVH